MNNSQIKGKKILLFIPNFFSYEIYIRDKMILLGANVDLFDVRSVKRPIEKGIIKRFPNAYKQRTAKYYDEILLKVKNNIYDYILIVKADMTPNSFLVRLREEYPNAKLCLYLWDSIRNVPGIEEKFKYFDIISSFDWDDCQKYSFIRFRPLFFIDAYRMQRKESNFEYDICFIGTGHTDRYKIIRQIDRLARTDGLNCFWFLYYQSKLVYWLYYLTKKEYRERPQLPISFKKLNVNEIRNIINKTGIVVDIEASTQSGLTMRTIEMLGMNKKIITTNSKIKEYDFFNSSNILVIDRANPSYDINFIKEPYVDIPENIYEKYSIDSWIYDVIGIGNHSNNTEI